MARYTEHSVPKNITVKVKHFHEGNSSKAKRHGKPYVTRAILIDRRRGVISMGEARCSRKDNPRRDLGRQIAIGRAMKSLDMHREG